MRQTQVDIYIYMDGYISMTLNKNHSTELAGFSINRLTDKLDKTTLSKPTRTHAWLSQLRFASVSEGVADWIGLDWIVDRLRINGRIAYMLWVFIGSTVELFF